MVNKERKKYMLYTGVEVILDTIPEYVIIRLDLNQFNIPKDNKVGFQVSKQDLETLIKFFEL